MAEPKKVVVKLNIHDDKDKKKAMKAVSCLEGINSIGVDMKESKMTVIGDVDPVQVVAKLKKQWCAQIDTVGPAKDEKKEKEEKAKKEKEEKEKKEKKEKEDKEKKEKEEKAKLAELLKKFGCPPYPPCPPPPPYPPQYYVQSVEENPNSCVIC